jgi:hypothetical protein
MGAMEDTGTPAGITFASKPYDDFARMSYAYAFEQAHPEGRFVPPPAPELESDIIPPLHRNKPTKFFKGIPPALEVEAEKSSPDHITLRDSVKVPGTSVSLEYDLEVYVDGVTAGPVKQKRQPLECHGEHRPTISGRFAV